MIFGRDTLEFLLNPRAQPPKSGAPRCGKGALAQLGERLHGMQEVSGSIPLGSTKFRYAQFYGA